MLHQQDTVLRTSLTLQNERRKTVSEFLQLAQATAAINSNFSRNPFTLRSCSIKWRS